ncbi:MAG: calcium/sodium antiporter [Bacteroidota bacterium]
MTLLQSLLYMGGGMILLIGGAEALVRGAAALALRFGITPLVVGLTVVAFGTSSPELMVSVKAAIGGNGPVALGNVVGSNIANLGLIVGVSASLSPLAVDRRLLTRDMPVMIGSMLLLCAFLLNGVLGPTEGVILTCGIVLYTVWGITSSRRETKAARASADELPTDVQDALDAPTWRVVLNVVFVALGLALLIIGAGWLVDGAVAAAQQLGVSEAVIGLTLVAIGTSLPELATTIVAAIRGHGEIALGGAIGSNVFNVLGVIGPAAVAAPIASEGIEWSVLAIMLAMAVLTAFFLSTGGKTRRWEGAVLLAAYAGYLWWVVAG